MSGVNKIRAVLAPVCIMLFFSACRPAVVSKDKLMRMIGKDKYLCQTQTVQGIKVQIRYMPYQLMVAQELGTGPDSGGGARITVLEKKYGPQYYFRLTFSKDNKEAIRQLGSFHQYSDMLQVLSFELGGHISATTETNDTTYLKDYAFQQDFGLSHENASLLVFAKQDFSKGKEMRISIGEFGLGIGELSFVFRKEDMDRLPALDYRQLD